METQKTTRDPMKMSPISQKIMEMVAKANPPSLNEDSILKY